MYRIIICTNHNETRLHCLAESPMPKHGNKRSFEIAARCLRTLVPRGRGRSHTMPINSEAVFAVSFDVKKRKAMDNSRHLQRRK